MQTVLSYIITSSDDTAETEYELPRSVLELLGMESPGKALFTGVYGARSMTRVTSYLAANYPVSDGQSLRPVDVQFNLRIETVARCGLEEGDVLVKDADTLNTTRLRADLIHWIRSRWKKELGDRLDEQESKFPREATRYPQFIDKLRSRGGFPHLKAIVYPVDSPAGKITVCSFYCEPASFAPWVQAPGRVVF